MSNPFVEPSTFYYLSLSACYEDGKHSMQCGPPTLHDAATLPSTPGHIDSLKAPVNLLAEPFNATAMHVTWIDTVVPLESATRYYAVRYCWKGSFLPLGPLVSRRILS